MKSEINLIRPDFKTTETIEETPGHEVFSDGGGEEEGGGVSSKVTKDPDSKRTR